MKLKTTMKTLTLTDHNPLEVMDISSEKAEIMRRFEQVYDASLIQAIKNLLDFGLSKQSERDEALEASIDRGLNESKNGKVRPHQEVMTEMRARYKA
jgi:predicted transcriptional regulator